ncbi:MAG: Tol biopolymer transporter periplasmic protein [Cyanobacteriota bacterium]|nr:Tol biopolymer transporter periplasmic protein [Cyanobacteriota bacterium]
MASQRVGLSAACSALLLAIALSSCSNLGRRQTTPAGFTGSQQQRDPALSGNGRLLASIVDTSGRSAVMLQEQPSGRVVALRHLRGHWPHSSPSLSWNGRYLALVLQQGSHSVAVIEDRLSGQLLRLPAPAGARLERLSLAPDAQTLALQLLQGGQQRVQVFDLSGRLEPDRAGGLRSSNPVAP